MPSLARLAELVGGTVEGAPVEVTGLASLEDAGPEELTFVTDEKRLPRLAESRAGAVLLGQGVDRRGKPAIIVRNPHAALIVLLAGYALAGGLASRLERLAARVGEPGSASLVEAGMERELLAIAGQGNYPPPFLNAQVSALPFYLREGFLAVGGVFEEAGIPHRRMELRGTQIPVQDLPLTERVLHRDAGPMTLEGPTSIRAAGVRMAGQARRGLCLLTRDLDPVHEEVLGEDLDRGLAPELRVPRAVHLSHPSRTDGLDAGSSLRPAHGRRSSAHS